MFSIMAGKTVSLAPTSDSAPFTTKYIPLGAAPVVLGRTHATDGATHTNGMFALGGAPSSDLPVSEAHAQLYTQNGQVRGARYCFPHSTKLTSPTYDRRAAIAFVDQVYIDDLGSAHGTWVDGQKIKIPTPLRTGSIIVSFAVAIRALARRATHNAAPIPGTRRAARTHSWHPGIHHGRVPQTGRGQSDRCVDA